jgi:hypothetical protein
MHSEFANLLIDGVLASLLAVTLFFCIRLNKRIQILQDNRSELAETIREFDACTTRATESIAEIHTVTQRISENIQHKIDKANFVADDLQFLLERGNKFIEKNSPQPAAKPAPAPTAKPAAAATAGDDKTGSRVRSRAEQELLNIVKSSGKDSA